MFGNLSLLFVCLTWCFRWSVNAVSDSDNSRRLDHRPAVIYSHQVGMMSLVVNTALGYGRR